MKIVGELINTSRKEIAGAVEEGDAQYIKDLARKQVEAGADYVDVNAGTWATEEEPEVLKWLVETVQEEVDTPLCIDSPNPKALETALKHHKGRALLNSISAEKKRYDQVLPLVLDYGAEIIALCMDDEGMPATGKRTLEIADKLAAGMLEAGVKEEDIFFDPLLKPVSANTNFGKEVLEAIEMINQKYPKAHTICGISNVSHGLPHRKLLNSAFLVMCMTKNIDAVILDPLDKKTMSLLRAAAALLGKDEYCMRYIKAHRAGELRE